MTISENHVVSFHYTLTDQSGNTIDSSADGDPLTYLHGAGNIIPGLEKELAGKSVGDKFVVNVAAAEGYGEVIEQMIQQVPKEAFQGAPELQVGMQFEAGTQDGGRVPVTITAIEGDTVTVDGNHPLAGKDLTFDVSIEDIRDASEEELAHGHVHGPGGHHH